MIMFHPSQVKCSQRSRSGQDLDTAAWGEFLELQVVAGGFLLLLLDPSLPSFVLQ